MHIDADAFFASVEQVLNPALKGKAVLVGSPSGQKGIVSAASYEAKRFGIYSGMPMYLASRKCPQAVIVPGHFQAYSQFSREMYRVFCNYTPEVEMVSIDEAYLDITGCGSGFLQSSPKAVAKSIMFDIFKRLGISVSCGLSGNKTVSKVASSTHKPHKLTVVPFGKEAKFLAPLPLRALPGVGPKTFAALERYGFQKIEDVAKLGLNEVFNKLGIQGIPLWKKCLGFDNSEINSSSHLPKSISREKTFYTAVSDGDLCLNCLKELTTEILEKLRRHEMKAKTVVIKIRYKKTQPDEDNGKWSFEDRSFQQHLGFFASSNFELWPVIRELFLKSWTKGREIRLLGVGVSSLRQNYNLSLFGDSKKHDDLFKSVDLLNKTYGEEAVKYGV